MLEGRRPGEIARELEVPPSWVSDRLAEFYIDVLLAHGLFPPLPKDEYAALRDDIAERGIVQPILVDENDETIEGHTRRRIARELGIDCPKRVIGGLNAAEKRELSIALNVGRRHLSRAEKRAVVVAELMANAGRSDRRVAAVCGVDHKTVGALRRELADEERRYLNPNAEVESGEIPQPAADTKILGRADCPCCGNEVVVVRRSGELLLEQSYANEG